MKYFRTFWLMGWLAVACVALAFGISGNRDQPQTIELTAASVRMPSSVAIESIRVGDRVMGELSPAELAGESQVNEASWHHLKLMSELRWEDGTIDEVRVETLQPPEWIARHNAHVGAEVPLPLDLIEMGLPEGITATVVEIAPCPAIQDGPGRVVLTTVNHLNRDVYELTVESHTGLVETVRPTALHKFYRPADDAWVSTMDLRPGDELMGVDGPIFVRRVAKVLGVQRVYNMTVEGEHVYRVSLLGALVHNNACATPANPKHHVFPQELRHEFEDGLSIPIDEYTIELPPAVHGRIHPDWNGDWQQFFDEFAEAGRSPTPDDAMDYALELIGEYGLDRFGPVVPSR